MPTRPRLRLESLKRLEEVLVLCLVRSSGSFRNPTRQRVMSQDQIFLADASGYDQITATESRATMESAMQVLVFLDC